MKSIANPEVERAGSARESGGLIRRDMSGHATSTTRAFDTVDHSYSWSGPPVTYDLDDRADRARVYEQVLREGTEDDVRFYVGADHLLELWDELVLPPQVRDAWRPWIEARRRTR